MAFRKEASSPDQTAEIVNAIPQLSDTLRNAVLRRFPVQDQPRVLDALSKILSEDVRNSLVILAYGDRVRFDEAVRLQCEDYRNLYYMFHGPKAWLTEDEANLRRIELGFPVRSPDDDDNQREARINAFVGSHTGYPLEQIELSTRLQEDLGLDGPDGVRFMEAFAKEFWVNLKAFRLERHFHLEEETAWQEVVRLIFRKPLPTLAPITVQDLINAAKEMRFISR